MREKERNCTSQWQHWKYIEYHRYDFMLNLRFPPIRCVCRIQFEKNKHRVVGRFYLMVGERICGDLKLKTLHLHAILGSNVMTFYIILYREIVDINEQIPNMHYNNNRSNCHSTRAISITENEIVLCAFRSLQCNN